MDDGSAADAADLPDEVEVARRRSTASVRPPSTQRRRLPPSCAATPSVAEVEPVRELELALDGVGPVLGLPVAAAQGLDGHGRQIAVLDSGVDATHPTFAGAVDLRGLLRALGHHVPRRRRHRAGTGRPAPPCATSTVPPRHPRRRDRRGPGRRRCLPGVAPRRRLVAVRIFGMRSGRLVADTASLLAGLDHVIGLRQERRADRFGEPLAGSSAPTCSAATATRRTIGVPGHSLGHRPAHLARRAGGRGVGQPGLGDGRGGARLLLERLRRRRQHPGRAPIVWRRSATAVPRSTSSHPASTSVPPDRRAAARPRRGPRRRRRSSPARWRRCAPGPRPSRCRGSVPCWPTPVSWSTTRLGDGSSASTSPPPCCRWVTGSVSARPAPPPTSGTAPPGPAQPDLRLRQDVGPPARRRLGRRRRRHLRRPARRHPHPHEQPGGRWRRPDSPSTTASPATGAGRRLGRRRPGLHRDPPRRPRSTSATPSPSGPGQVSFAFGVATDRVVVGDWDGTAPTPSACVDAAGFLLRNALSAGRPRSSSATASPPTCRWSATGPARAATPSASAGATSGCCAPPTPPGAPS